MKRILFSRATLIAVLMLAGLVSAAQAQKAPRTPGREPIAVHPGNGSSATLSDGVLNPQYLGWNYVHATSCEMYDYDGYTYVVLYPAEGGDYWTASSPYQTLLLTACQTGNWIGLYVYDDYGDWSELQTYDYK